MADSLLKNIRIVLVEPKGTGNIGSVARAMKNMGVSDLALVGGGKSRTFWARAMAVHAGDILERARRFATFREAVADCGLVVGTTCRGGLYRGHSLPPRELAPKIVAAARDAKVAIVFGPEDHGLNNQDLCHCQWLMIIPSHPEYLSLNVAQAAMVCLYELFVAAQGEIPRETIARAPAGLVEILFDRMRRVLLKVGFLDSQNPDHMLLALRRLFGRAGLEERDVNILNGLFRQVEWYLENGKQVTEEKEKKAGETLDKTR